MRQGGGAMVEKAGCARVPFRDGPRVGEGMTASRVGFESDAWLRGQTFPSSPPPSGLVHSYPRFILFSSVLFVSSRWCLNFRRTYRIHASKRAFRAVSFWCPFSLGMAFAGMEREGKDGR